MEQRQNLKKATIKKQEQINLVQKQEQTTFQKLCTGLLKLLFGDSKLTTSINIAIVSSTYIQCLQLVNIILLFTYFSDTNSQIYAIIISVLCAIFFLIDMIPKISQKYYIVFNLVSISTGIIVAAFLGVFKIISDNLITFEKICKEFNSYYLSQSQNNSSRMSFNVVLTNKQSTLQMCQQIITKFWIQIGIQLFFIVLKIIHFAIYLHAYRVSKEKHEFLQRKRRRKQRYNQMVREKSIWDENRKV